MRIENVSFIPVPTFTMTNFNSKIVNVDIPLVEPGINF